MHNVVVYKQKSRSHRPALCPEQDSTLRYNTFAENALPVAFSRPAAVARFESCWILEMKEKKQQVF